MAKWRITTRPPGSARCHFGLGMTNRRRDVHSSGTVVHSPLELGYNRLLLSGVKVHYIVRH
ncbi:hypothetical protein SCLCIDRAFT_1225020 [Scleroderma citrinum Foug A]|uniref:Uncharacterized protein n=1 Tax=Scleroderma citrinum Foug A TaxID=1036808 RepID=A0A0C2ZD38_9AGAM|nr:hypothetical protein SCLCIDRAFT_1225020 [Scleroderma citrinum Foug A]